MAEEYESPDKIYLEPACVMDHGDSSDRLWCEDDVWNSCDECGAPSVEYWREDICQQMLDALVLWASADKEEAGEARQVARQIAREKRDAAIDKAKGRER